MCLHLPLNLGAVPLVASVMNTEVEMLKASQIATIGLFQNSVESGLLVILLEIFAEKWGRPLQLYPYRFCSKAIEQGTLLATVIVCLGLLTAFETPSSQLPLAEMLLSQKEDSVGTYLEATNAILLSPLLEEFLHRGLLLRCLLNIYSPRWSLLIGALIFASVHGSWESFPFHFISGLLFGLGFLLTNANLLTVTIAHGLSNAVAVGTFIDILT